MMKHIKRKLLREVNFGPEFIDELMDMTPSDHETQNAAEKIVEEGYANHEVIQLIDDGQIVFTIRYESAGKTYFLPEPNPVLINFYTCQNNLKAVADAKAQLLFMSANQQPQYHKVRDELYRYVSAASICATSLFSSLEAFINYKLPDDYEWRGTNGLKPPVDRLTVQKKFKFDDKIELVMKDIFMDRYFPDVHPQEFSILQQLKKLRDAVMHTTSYTVSANNVYKDLYTLLLDFNFEQAMFACMAYINFYEPGLVEECDCGVDY